MLTRPRPTPPTRLHPDYLWRNPEPRTRYDAVVVGGGGHGLAAAYYLASRYGMSNVAVVERGWLGGGNVARNTTIVRSNYLRPESEAIYETGLRMWETLAAELDYDLLFSQRGAVELAYNSDDVRSRMRQVYANQVVGIDAEWLTPEEIRALCPSLNISPDARYPIVGGTLQRRAGIAKHDHMAWAFARAADRLGVDLVQGAEVTGFDVVGDRLVGVRTSRGSIQTERAAISVAGHSSVVAALAGVRLPLQTWPLQALVSELLEPIVPIVIMAASVYLSQAHKGEIVMGSARDGFTSYDQRGSFHVITSQMAEALELLPRLARAHVVRTWAGIVDVSPDASPILGHSQVHGLYLNCGWGTGGFKVTPAAGLALAHLIATDTSHAMAAPFTLDRFTTGRLIGEQGVGAAAH